MEKTVEIKNDMITNTFCIIGKSLNYSCIETHAYTKQLKNSEIANSFKAFLSRTRVYFQLVFIQKVKNPITDIVFSEIYYNIITLHQKELFDNPAPQIAEIRTIAKSSPLFLK